jgi:membrane associated rhomboid family serine protease/Zn-finger nucleic acid-binding protein
MPSSQPTEEYLCPSCALPLEQSRNQMGSIWQCPSCHGALVALPILRKSIARSAINELWQAARTGQGQSGRPCPLGRHPMQNVQLTSTDPPLVIDVCLSCGEVWFDANEFEALPKPLPTSTPSSKHVEPKLSPEARRAAAMFKVAALQENAPTVRDEGPEEGWKIFLAVLGLPVEVSGPYPGGVPWVTFGVAGVVTFTSLFVPFVVPNALKTFAFVPADPLRLGGLTLVTAFFLHAGLAHLLSNLYFLLVFGNAVEDALGPWKYSVLLLVATVVGNLCHMMGNLDSTVPCLGASGGISGVIIFYALTYPRTRFAILYSPFWIIVSGRVWTNLPVWMLVVFWVGLQVLLAGEQILGVTNVAALAHLGGAATGAAFWQLWR